MNKKSFGAAFTTSLIIHGILLLILAMYLITQTETFRNLISAEVLEVKNPPKPKVRKPVIKPIPKPIIPAESTVVVEQITIQPRTITASQSRPTSINTQTILEFSNNKVRINAPITTNTSMLYTTNTTILLPNIVKHNNLPLSSAPHELASSGLTTSSPLGRVSWDITRNNSNKVQVKGITIVKVAGLTMVKEVGAASDVLSDVVKHVTLGNVEVPPLERGEPGGRVIGKGKDIRGVLRFGRIKHSISDWWADSSSLNALVKWLNERTKIHADLNVEGGSMKLTDANFLKCPLVFFTGHDPGMAKSRGLTGEGRGAMQGRLDNKFTEGEATALRKYLVERGGLLIFDDCGVNAAATVMPRIFLAQMRVIMPEYQLGRLPNDHEIYKNFYRMSGPPIGFDIFWWGTKPPKRNYLEGISVGEKLAVLMGRRDYMCAMEAVSLPTRSVHYSPGVYRFFTNLAIYSLTTGKISDYNRYIPEDRLAKQALPTRSPAAATISATGVSVQAQN